jgi:type II secretory pathway component PulC
VNLLLIIIISILGLRLYKAWVRPLELSIEVSQEQKDKEDVQETKKTEERRLDISYYDIISQKDLFRPSRSGISGTSTGIPLSPKNMPKLFGTIITAGEKSALLEDPITKKTRLYHVNDTLAGFIVYDIQEDKVVLSKEGRLIEVSLREDKGIKPPPPVRQPRQPLRKRRSSLHKQTSRTNIAERPDIHEMIEPPPPVGSDTGEE